jgi:aspartyl-tRNA(Asn)/glutamyl-tRNA(Gln) amidotransferase subunit A
MAETDLTFKSVNELSALITSKEVSVTEVTKAFLERIERLQPRLNAYITICREEALTSARAMDESLALGDPISQPLFGIPVALKDQIDTCGVLTTNGSLALADHVPAEDATVVAKLKQAGAIILGKLNMNEFAAAGGEDPPFGEPRNPWNTAYSPGGSSSGSGIAVSAGLCAISLGEDSGGSGRIPASYCGVVSIRPSAGLVSRHGIHALSPSLDTVSPLGRNVADCAAQLQVIAGYDSQDALSSRRPVPDYNEGLRDSIKGVRMGLIKEFMNDPNLDSEIREATRKSVDVFTELGALVEEVSIPYINYSMYALGIIIWCDGSALNLHLVKSRYQLFKQSTRLGFLAASMLPATAYLRARQAQSLIRDEVLKAFQKYDLLLSPTSPKPVPQIANMLKTANFPVKEDVLKRHADGHVAFAPLTGCPAISIPCGFSQTGLPIGLQIAGRPFEDKVVLRAAYAYEQNTEWHNRHPDL